jgi:hypothetical protein
VGTANPFLGVDYQAAYSVTPINTFHFRVASSMDAGCPDASVSFVAGASNAEGSSLLDSTGAPVPADGGFSAFTDFQGNVSAQLQSGSQAGQVTVIATVVLPNGHPTSASGSSSVVGTQPNVANCGITCSPVNLPVYSGDQNEPCAIKSNYPGSTTCTVHLADRFHNAIGISVPVHFYSEAGVWQKQTVNTPSYGDTTDPPGVATNVLKTDQSTLPVDVDPIPGEPSYMGTCLGLNRTYNPRDGLVTVMAAFTGEEAFQDLFATGNWQPGDPFVDLPQPFVDSDDSSAWKPGDACAGSSSDGGCDGPNSQWDGNANVWVQSHVLYTGDPVTVTWTPAVAPTIYGMAEIGSVTWADENINNPASQTVCNVTAPSSGNPQGLTCTYPIPPAKADPPDSLGMDAIQVQICDAGMIPVDGGMQSNTICSYLTVVANYPMGFTNSYQVATSTGHDAGPAYCINATAALFSDPVLASQNCGTVFGF